MTVHPAITRDAKLNIGGDGPDLSTFQQKLAERRAAKAAEERARQEAEEAERAKLAEVQKDDEKVVGLEDMNDECTLDEFERKRRYFNTAVVGIVKEMLETFEGQRNVTLNALAYRLGRVAAGTGQPVHQAAVALAAAAERKGLPKIEIGMTLKSGIESGMKHPLDWSHS